MRRVPSQDSQPSEMHATATKVIGAIITYSLKGREILANVLNDKYIGPSIITHPWPPHIKRLILLSCADPILIFRPRLQDDELLLFSGGKG